MKLYIYSLIAGLFWGLWPIIMKKSGAEGFVSGAIFTGASFIAILPFVITSGQIQSLEPTPKLGYAVLAGVIGAAGVLFFNTALAKADPANIGTMILIMIMAQVAVPTIFQLVFQGDYSLRKLVGIVGACIATYLLASK